MVQRNEDKSASGSEARQLSHRHGSKEIAETLSADASGRRSHAKRVVDNPKVGTIHMLLGSDQLSLIEPGNDQLVEPVRNVRKNGAHFKDHDALLEAKDQTIAELKEQVAFLRCELERKDAILLRMTEGNEMMPTFASETPDTPLTKDTPGGTSDSNRGDAQEEQERSERPVLPDGYRVVAIASDAWVLVAPRGLRVAGYRGELDLWQAALDARKHHRREL